jgi:ABC-type Zn uptake system ZnuABC Zn-binding protein ZnuA
MSRAALLFMLAGCSAAGGGETGRGEALVLTTFQPTYSFAWQVALGSPALRVVNLAPRSKGPHEFSLDDPETGAASRELVRRAAAVVTLRSLPVSPAMDRVYPWCRNENIRIVEIDPAVTWDPGKPRLALVADPEDSALSAKAGESERPPNPHVWLSLSHAVRMVERIAEDFGRLDPDHAELYARNADRYEKALRALKAEFDARLSGADSVAALTEAFPYLTADFGIPVADYLLAEMTPEQATARIRRAGVRVVLAEEAPEPALARAVKQAGARIVVLRTLETGWGEGEALDPGGYLKGMRANLEKLAHAVGR